MEYIGERESATPCLDTVRALHQTIIALRIALERSRLEVSQLKAHPRPTNRNKPKKHVRIKEEAPPKLASPRSKSLDNLSMDNITLPDSSLIHMSSAPNISRVAENATNMGNAQSEPALHSTSDLEQGEVDDIDLIFTTGDAEFEKFEELVPIETKQKLCPQPDFDQSFSDRELDDDVFHNSATLHNNSVCNSKSDNSINPDEKSPRSYYSFQDSSFENRSLEKDESFDRFEERIRIVETDISKCGIVDTPEYVTGRRNTCPNPLQYRPLIHRDALGKCTRKGRNALNKCESAAQTDITALPRCSWRSESCLVHKVKGAERFPTLPSKFPLRGSRLKLSEKTNVEARRVLLSDIGFTSMVPELSRSADHLCPANTKPLSQPVCYGQYLRATDLYSPAYTSQKFTWTTTATASPSEVSQLHSRFGSTCPLASPPPPWRRFSAPVSPMRRGIMKPTLSKVRFANGSLPELYSAWGLTTDSGDSTDSLLDEAENYLRRSIDCIVSGDDAPYKSEVKTRGYRRASAPEPAGDNVPPQDWHPFLPRNPRDLRLDYWIKIIVPEGRVRGGRVRYVGALLNQNEQHVGVQLSTPDGYCDGSYNSRRYFNCEPYHGIFVPFKKVVMGWKP